ncbi:MAG: phosphotransferase family protein [Thermaerobacter sp.]|nr:phosphotransferase family protein [Thermaerobacter sp.]
MNRLLSAVKPENDFDRNALAEALSHQIPESGHGPFILHQFAAGVSNLTYLIERGSWQGVLRTPPRGPLEPKAHDMVREGRWLAKLAPAYPLAPRVLWQEDTGTVIGFPFYVMEYRPGLTIDQSFPPGMTITPAVCRTLSEQFAAGLAALHHLPWQALDLDEFSYQPEQFVARQVRGWAKRYVLADGEPSREAQAVMAWLADTIPQSGETAIVHNDFKFNNIVLDGQPPYRFKAVVDWEMAGIGDPVFDLAVSLSYWMEPADPPVLRQALSGVTATPGFFSADQVARRYAAVSGRDLSLLPYYRVLANFKLAVIMQQLHARWLRGQSQDRRLEHLGDAISALVHKAWVLAGAPGS